VTKTRKAPPRGRRLARVSRSAQLPRITVVVPCLDQGAYLPQALDSIFTQEYPHTEVLLLDGGSSDETVALVEQRYGRQLSFWRSRPDAGQTSAIHEGFARATGDLVAWLNADDFYLNDSLWVVARAYGQHPACGLFVGNGLRLIENEGRMLPFGPRHVAIDGAALVSGVDYILQPSCPRLRSTT